MKAMTESELDALLGQNIVDAIPDNGFTARTMQSLPERSARANGPSVAILPAALILGGLFTWLALRPSTLVQEVASEWLTQSFGASSVLLLVVLLGLSALSVCWALEETQDYA